MKNKYPGLCRKCNKRVTVGKGITENINGMWHTQHLRCATPKEVKPDQLKLAY